MEDDLFIISLDWDVFHKGEIYIFKIYARPDERYIKELQQFKRFDVYGRKLGRRNLDDIKQMIYFV